MFRKICLSWRRTRRAASPVLATILLVGLAALLFAGLVAVTVPMLETEPSAKIIDFIAVDKNEDHLIDRILISVQNNGKAPDFLTQIIYPDAWKLVDRPLTMNMAVGESLTFIFHPRTISDQLHGTEDFVVDFVLEKADVVQARLTDLLIEPSEIAKSEIDLTDGNLVYANYNQSYSVTNSEARHSGNSGIILGGKDVRRSYVRSEVTDINVPYQYNLDDSPEFIAVGDKSVIGFWVRGNNIPVTAQLNLTFQLFINNVWISDGYFPTTSYSIPLMDRVTGWGNATSIRSSNDWNLLLVDFAEELGTLQSDLSSFKIGFLGFTLKSGEPVSWSVMIDDVFITTGI